MAEFCMYGSRFETVVGNAIQTVRMERQSLEQNIQRRIFDDNTVSAVKRVILEVEVLGYYMDRLLSTSDCHRDLFSYNELYMLTQRSTLRDCVKLAVDKIIKNGIIHEEEYNFELIDRATYEIAKMYFEDRKYCCIEYCYTMTFSEAFNDKLVAMPRNKNISHSEVKAELDRLGFKYTEEYDNVFKTNVFLMEVK